MCTRYSFDRPEEAIARIAEGSHPSIELDAGDTVIFSSRTIPGNEHAVGNVINNLAAKGIKVITYDADSLPDARTFFVNQATPEGIGQTLMDEAARLLNGEGEFAVILSTLTASNMQEWLKHIKARIHVPADPVPGWPQALPD